MNTTEKTRTEAPVITGVFSAMNRSAVTVAQERCAKVRNRNVACLKCAHACTSGCISVRNGTLVVDASKCVGCGTCATVCPTCALEANNPPDEQLFLTCKKALHNKRVVIACGLACTAVSGMLDTAHVAQVVCAGRVDESLIVRLVREGAQSVCVVCGVCDACAQREGRKTATMVVESANVLLEAWGSSARACVCTEFPESVLRAPEQSEATAQNVQQAVPHAVAQNVQQAAAQALATFFATEQQNQPLELTPNSESETAREFTLPHVMNDGTLPHFLPDRRERLLDALFAVGQPVQQEISSRLWGWVVIDGTKCVSCRMCATFCPTGAIQKFDEEDGTFGVNHTPANCVKCRSCEDICPADAIIIHNTIQTKFLASSLAHRYVMKERPTTLNNAHQILSHMKHQMAGSDIFER